MTQFQHEYITSPTNTDDFHTQLVNLNEQIDRIDVTPPCVQRKRLSSSSNKSRSNNQSKINSIENLPGKGTTSKKLPTAKSRPKSNLRTPKKAAKKCYFYQQQQPTNNITSSKKKHKKPRDKRIKNTRIQQPTKNDDASLTGPPEDSFKTPQNNSNRSERMASVRSELRVLTDDAGGGQNHPVGNEVDNDLKPRSTELRWPTMVSTATSNEPKGNHVQTVKERDGEQKHVDKRIKNTRIQQPTKNFAMPILFSTSELTELPEDSFKTPQHKTRSEHIASVRSELRVLTDDAGGGLNNPVGNGVGHDSRTQSKERRRPMVFVATPREKLMVGFESVSLQLFSMFILSKVSSFLLLL